MQSTQLASCPRCDFRAGWHKCPGSIADHHPRLPFDLDACSRCGHLFVVTDRRKATMRELTRDEWVTLVQSDEWDYVQRRSGGWN